MIAAAGWNRLELTSSECILIARDTEWYAGARSRTSDQGAVILSRRAWRFAYRYRHSRFRACSMQA